MASSQTQWVTLNELVISFMSPGAMHDAQWDPFVKELQAKPVKKYLSTSFGVVDVNSVQRRKIVEVLNSKAIKVAVVTDERLVRGIVTAASWLGLTNVKTFSWTDVKDAVKYLDTSFEVDHVVRTLMKMRDSWEQSAKSPTSIAR